jgi:hypothetical protein
MEVLVFIDDFTHARPRDAPSEIVSDSFAYVASILAAESLPLLQDGFRRKKEELASKWGTTFPEFHGTEIVSRCGVNTVWEMVQEGIPEYDRIRAVISERLSPKIHPKAADRFSVAGSAKLPIATVTRHASLIFAKQRLGALSVSLIEDREIPRDSQLTADFIRKCRSSGLKVNTAWDQDSRDHAGLQLADLSATVLRLGVKFRDRTNYLREHGLALNGDAFDSFTQEFLRQDVMSLLEMGVRSFRAVDLEFMKCT